MSHKNSPLKQLTLNFGQKAPKTTACQECGMLVNMSSREEQQAHEKMHRAEKTERDKVLSYATTLAKCEHIVGSYADGKCVVISADTVAKPVLARLVSILSYVDQDLGIHCDAANANDRLPSMAKIYLFVSASSNKISGFCLAEPVAQAYWCSHTQRGQLTYDESKPCERSSGAPICGISRIWVSEAMRRKGIATRLLDCVCSNFFYVVALEPRSQLAFSDPTEFGQALAKSYLKTDRFLVYQHRKRV